MLSLVVAASLNHAIGKNNQLLWHLPNDLRFFKNTTWGCPVIMGRKTFESVGKPLPGRTNIIITRQTDWQSTGTIVANNLDHALQLAKDTGCTDAFIIGGGEIYQLSMQMADRVYLTLVHTNIDGDTYFPPLDPNNWQLHQGHHLPADEKNAFATTYQIWDRIRS